MRWSLLRERSSRATGAYIESWGGARLYISYRISVKYWIGVLGAQKFDCIIVGAGIVGLAIAREIKHRHKGMSVLLLEKELDIGLHASGRNSGVLHSGLYYEPGSIKARVCVEGSSLMAQYCEDRNLPLNRTGKVIVPTTIADDPMLDVLAQRSSANGVKSDLINQDELVSLEPWVHSVSGRALHVSSTAVVSPGKILDCLQRELKAMKVDIRCNAEVVRVRAKESILETKHKKFSYGHLFNAAGLYADKVAHGCDVGSRYTMLPFRGMYRELSQESKIKFNGLVYPVPDLSMPFLGLHFTKTIEGRVFIGPTATPVLSRENYSQWDGVKPLEAFVISRHLAAQYVINKQGFRKNTHQELNRWLRSSAFLDAARRMVPAIVRSDIKACSKVGIRAQLLDLKQKKLSMDFIVEHAANTTHVLNAVSPAFTSAFSFVKHSVVKL